MDLLTVQDALRAQKQRPMDRRAAERAIGAGLLRWASWCDAVQRGQGAAGTMRGQTSPQHATWRSQFTALGIEGHGELWSLVEMIVMSRLSQANGHARAMGTLLYHDGASSSVRALLRVHAEACMRGVWVATQVDALTALHRATAEFAEEANAMPADRRRKLHDETIGPLALAAGLNLRPDKRGRWRASGTVRPNTRELIRHMPALAKELTEWATRSYGLQTATIHSTLQGWAASILNGDAISLRALSLDLAQTTAVHNLLQEIYEGWHDWCPHDAMESARRASLSDLSLALLRADGSHSRSHTGDSP